jgi:D-alanyl-D-alanine endopeptidase (penicillin-binding protein 7)
MMKNFSGKIAFAGAIVIIALLSRFAYPRLYSVATSDATGAATSSATDTVPQFVFPALSFMTTGGAPTSSPKPVDDPAGVGAVSGISAPPMPATNTIFVAPLGPVADSTFSRVGMTPPPVLPVQEALVADLSSGAVLMSENASGRWPLASLTKLMTATLVYDHLSLTEPITITQAEFDVYPQEKTLRIGDVYTVEDLLHFLLMPSSNVAAEALATAYGRTQFIAAMNARAAAWGMTHTHYVDPSGLADGDQSTPGDLLLLTQKIYADYPQLLAITRTPTVTVTNLATGATTTVQSINQFAGETDFIGGKTGYTDQADGNLLSLFSDDGHPVMVLIFGTEDWSRFIMMEQLYHWVVANFRP